MMTKDEIVDFIAGKTVEGLSLPEIQDALKALGEKMTFRELRMLAAEVDIEVWKARDAKNAPKPAEKPEEKAADVSEKEGEFDAEDEVPPSPLDPALRGKTTVTVNPIQRPGFAANGSVSFGSGSTADWYLDQSGRLALDNLKGSKPDEQDVREFQHELQKAFGG